MDENEIALLAAVDGSERAVDRIGKECNIWQICGDETMGSSFCSIFEYNDN